MNATIKTIQQRPHLCNAMLFACVLLLVGAYVYSLSHTVVHVVMRKEASRDLASLQSEISTLEAEYMAVQHRISTEITKRTDLAAATEKIFIEKAAPNLVLSTGEGG